MRSFQRSTTFDPVPGNIVMLLHQIDRAVGAEGRYLDQVPQLLGSLREKARIESITASSAIEGVVVDDSRAPSILAGRTQRFRTRGEKEFAGYTAALDYLYNQDAGDLAVGLVLHLHRLLFSFTDGRGGFFKTDDNLVVSRETDGTRTVRFRPVSAQETPSFAAELVERTNAELAETRHHPLLITAAFALDLLCIHPFADGNGRVARLATSFLLDRTGYRVGRYLSIEGLIYATKDEYYAALGRSTQDWFDDGHHDLWPWAEYLLERIANAYELFEARISASTEAGGKQSRVRDHVLFHASASFTINDIRLALPGISDNTIRIVLTRLRNDGHIVVKGTGRSASWRRVS